MIWYKLCENWSNGIRAVRKEEDFSKRRENFQNDVIGCNQIGMSQEIGGILFLRGILKNRFFQISLKNVSRPFIQKLLA